MTRDADALIAFIDSRQQLPHAWGRRKNDCAGYALEAVQVQTGEDRAPELDWSNRTQAMRVIRSLGGMEAAIDRYFQRIAPAQAMRGDIGGVPDDDLGIHPMIVEGDKLVGPADKGNRRLKRSAMTIAWSAVLPRPKATANV